MMCQVPSSYEYHVFPSAFVAASPKYVAVSGSALRHVVVVARRGPRSIFVPAPGWRVAIGELAGRAAVVRVVARGEHRAADPVEEPGRRLVAIEAARRDVAGTDEDRVTLHGRGNGGRGRRQARRRWNRGGSSR